MKNFLKKGIGFVMLLAVVFVPVTTLAAFVWEETQPAGDTDKSWGAAASDSDGSHLIAAVINGRLYTSSDSGANWTERQPAGDANQTWRSVASDADGSHLIVGVDGGRLYTSSDGGVNWTERQPAGDVNQAWQSMASDADGSHLVAGVSNGRLYTSSDSGANWTERQPGGDANFLWRSIASDADGSHLIVGAQNSRLYTSSDGGVNWTERQPAGDTNLAWRTVASDADGSHLVAGVNSGRLYTSSDGGVNWTERQPAGNTEQFWRSTASDSDGSHLIALVYTGRLYTSSDGGANWIEEQPAGDFNRDWITVSSDADGSRLIVGVSVGGRLYIGAPDETAPTIDTLSPADDATDVALDTNLVITFDETVVASSTGDVVIYDASDDSVIATIPADDAQITIDGAEVTINPTADLDGATTYYVLIDVGAFEDEAGNQFAGIADETTWNFATDAVAPTIDTLSPADDATDVATNANLVITFDETVVASSTGDVVIHQASDDSVIATIPADDAQITIDGAEVTINPIENLGDQTEYYVLIDTGAFEDEAGNQFAGIADTTTWSFTTGDETIPTISTLSPADNATDVAIDTTLVITFDETVVATSSEVYITVYDASDDGVVEEIDIASEQIVVGDDTVTITLSADLDNETTYYVQIDEGAFEDETGNAHAGISDTTTWNFATENAPSSGGGGSSSSRRSSGGGSSNTPTPAAASPTGAAGSVEALMEQLVVLLTQLLEQLLAEQQGN